MSLRSREKRRLPVLVLPGLLAMCVACITSTISIGKEAPKPEQSAGANISPNREPGEENPGGNATTRKSINTRDAFSHASNGIGFEGEANFIGTCVDEKFRWPWASIQFALVPELSLQGRARTSPRCQLP
jgi:hypothetical protein